MRQRAVTGITPAANADRARSGAPKTGLVFILDFSNILPMDARRLETKAGQAATLLKALSNRRRLLILCRLTEGEMSVGSLAASLGLSQSALSQHLARLRARGLVRTRRDAQTIYYALAGEEAPRIMAALTDLYCPPEPARARRVPRSRAERPETNAESDH